MIVWEQYVENFWSMNQNLLYSTFHYHGFVALIIGTIFIFITETEDWASMKDKNMEAEPLNIWVMPRRQTTEIFWKGENKHQIH